MNMYLCKCSHNFMLLTQGKFNDDIFACFLVIMKNVFILFIQEYRRPNSRPPCDVIDDVIIMKNNFGIIWDDLFISEIILKLWLIFQIFQNGRHLSSRQTFSSEVIPEVEHARKIAISISGILSFWSTRLGQILTEICQFQHLTYFVTLWRHQWRHGCVKHNLHN